MTELMVRPATVDDMSAVTDITNYYISNSTCTMKECEETTKERIRLFKRNAGKYPTIVAEYGNVSSGGHHYLSSVNALLIDLQFMTPSM